jgi:hypothetical protein
MDRTIPLSRLLFGVITTNTIHIIVEYMVGIGVVPTKQKIKHTGGYGPIFQEVG